LAKIGSIWLLALFSSAATFLEWCGIYLDADSKQAESYFYEW
jgi:hypothetical protein